MATTASDDRLRLVFLGTPDAAVPPLRALVAAGHEVALVVTRADARRGRGGHLDPSPVKAAALELGLTVSHRVDDIFDLDPRPDLGVVVAFGRIIKPDVLAAVPMVNVHFSLLPRWRGAAPVERAILAGDRETGVCLMEVEEGLDTGGTYACEAVVIGEHESAQELRARLTEIGTRLLVDLLSSELPAPAPQVGEATYAAKIEPEERHLDWTQPAEHLARIVRIGDAWTTFRGKRLKVRAARPAPGELPAGAIAGDRVGTGEGSLQLLEVQPEGKGPQAALDWLRGARLTAGDRLV